MDTPNHALHSEDLLASSMHFWWIAFLRCSKDFWWICQQKGECLDERLVKVWKDFGDIFQYESFTQWWLHKGAALFDSPQLEMDLSHALSSGLQLLLRTDLKRPHPGMICLAIPLHLDSASASSAIIKLFEMARIRGKHYDRDAKYQVIKGGNEKNYRSIKPAYLSNALRVCVEHSTPGDQINQWGNYQMSKFLELCPQHHPQPGDSIIRTKNKQKAMRTKNSQAYGMAAKLIENVEIGRFPSAKKVETRVRWTTQQKQELDAAVASGRWQRSSWFANEHAFMLPTHFVGETYVDTKLQQQCLTLLNDLRDTHQSFFSTTSKAAPQ